MAIRTYPRATEPHFLSLAAALQPVLPLVSGLRYFQGVVTIDADFSGTTDQAIQALVDAAPVTSPLLDAKARVDSLSLLERAGYLTLLDAINVERARHSAAAITKLAFIQAVKDRVDTA